MKRLVYSPSVNVWVKTDTGVFDLSPYVTDVEVDRRIGQVSSAKVSFRNPRVTDERNKSQTRFMFTEHLANDGSVRPMFHPMDPIMITLTRLKGRPIQVFTGYCDTTPYVQLLPDVATLDASCTLKRLQYTYWDPALPYIRAFLDKHGWGVDPTSGQALSPDNEARKTNELNDTSFGSLLHAVLTEIGGWNTNNIYIQELPGEQIGQIVNKLYKDNAKESASSVKQFDNFLKDVIGSSSYGGAGAGGESGAANAPASENVVTNNGFKGTGIKWDFTGKASQFGSSHKYNITDSGDDSYGKDKPASGADPDVPGFAIRKTVGHKPNYNWFVIVSPSGRAAALPQTDWGPNTSTGRTFDINTAAAIGVFGYQKSGNGVNFPTDQGVWKAYFAGTGDKGRTKAEKIVKDGKI
jgi:hypothetical protein